MARKIRLMAWHRYSRMLTLIANKRGDMKEYSEILGRMYFARILQESFSPLNYETTQYLWNKYVKYFTRIP